MFFFLLITRIFGIIFGLNLLEQKEDKAVHLDYVRLEQYVPGLSEIIEQEEERLSYLGSVVLGLNDAFVELTGTLAGLSFLPSRTRRLSHSRD